VTALLVLGWVLAAGAVVDALLARRRLSAGAELVARACHELRAPLTAVGLAVEMLARRGEAPARTAGAIELQLRRARLALDDLAVAPAGGRQPDRLERVDVHELLEQTMTSWQTVAQAHDCELRLSGAPGRDATVRGDPVRLAQAAGNLVANAIEHGGGFVELRIRPVGGRVRIEVADAGPGLPAPVAQLAQRAGRRVDGRGRGLAIASEIAGRHGGRVAAAPAATGARIALELPAATAAPA
jgi:signal transduction histidine kinase